MILLRHFGEMSFREIAQLYRCPMGTVLARVHRGLKALRKLIGDEHGK
jgi:DNA-directed RNA polymerase specialized sigma24 family protein